MTSGPAHQETEFFANNNFVLNMGDVISPPSHVAVAPLRNGSLHAATRASLSVLVRQVTYGSF